MEREAFYSGYCRCIDNSRMVAVEADGSTLTEVDCNYETCPYVMDCAIARSITEFLEES